ncbi:ceramide synthase 1 [Acinonyx jubatus]|uniref:Ceramide synthase 1 n=2 Tax=Felidae TaxID=9681 RepID=A0A6J1XNX9_ACIJB|nr:ceramide synthase 1 [Acinonyx jubatus]
MGRSAGPSPGRIASTPGLLRPWSPPPPPPLGDRAPLRPQGLGRRDKPQVPSARAPFGAELVPAPPPSPSAPAGAPPAQLRRVTRGARLRRPPRAGASGGGGRRAGDMAAAGTAAGTAGPEPMPSYAQLVQRGWGSALAAARGCADCGWGLARRGLAEHAHLAPPELLLLALGALGWTALRSAATARLFRPLAKRCRLQPRDAAKMPESAWKFLFYLGAWSYSAYLLFGTDYPFFHDPPSVFYDWTSGMAVPRDIAAAYLLQGSFYGHSIYATLYMDAWRKDSVVMLVHHVVTLVLIVSSYAFRYHNVGILVLFLHDISDVQLEFTKLNVYFKSRGGSHHRLHALASDLGCLSFCLSWFWFRLYWFPLKVLYATCHCSLRSVPDIPFYFFFNALLLLLTLMNLYWFLYIVAFAAKVLTGQVRELKDVREYDAAEAQSPKASKAEKPLRNGLVRDQRF